MKNIVIVGAGAFGVALASVFNENKHRVTIYTSLSSEKDHLLNTRKCSKLNNYVINESINITDDLEIIRDCDLLVIAIPAQFVDDFCKRAKKYISNKVLILIASKGIENGTYNFIDQVVKRNIKNSNIAVLGGPTFAIDIINNVPVAFSIASKKYYTVTKKIMNLMSNDYVKLRASKDIIGLEVCGSIKNVIAIAAGMIDGMGYPESTQAMFITESLHDLKNLIDKLGGRKQTILTYAGFGDLLMTATSTKSRNYTYGYMVGQGLSKKEISKYRSNTTIEGLYTLDSIYNLLANKKVNIPIINLIKDICDDKKDVKELITLLKSIKK